MDPGEFTDPSTGTLVPTIGGQKAFIPSPLPPEINLSTVQQVLSEADQRLGELRGIGAYLANPYLLIQPLQRSEAIASSNIEGTFTSLPELLLLEAGVEDHHRRTDTIEVFNYVRALRRGIKRLEELPMSNRLILELHKELLYAIPTARRGRFPPGEFRKEQNFIGKQRDITKARFVPPPPPMHLQCMNDLERFIHHENYAGFPPLVFLAFIHYQFETIHPFPDGNGRVGRLMIPIILHERQIMTHPLLYMSQYFEDNKDAYVDLLLDISRSGKWVEWVEFFLRGVITSCSQTIEKINSIQKLRSTYMDRCQQARSSVLLTQIIEALFERPVITVPGAKMLTGTSYRAAKNNLDKLVQYEILTEGPADLRPKYYFANELVKLFD